MKSRITQPDASLLPVVTTHPEGDDGVRSPAFRRLGLFAESAA